MELAGVSREVAEEALRTHKTVEDALDALIQKPIVSGDAYLRGKPVVATGQDPEQEERCRKGRWLQDQVNAVFSVAHSQVKTQPPQLVPETEESQTSVPVASLPPIVSG